MADRIRIISFLIAFAVVMAFASAAYSEENPQSEPATAEAAEESSGQAESEEAAVEPAPAEEPEAEAISEEQSDEPEPVACPPCEGSQTLMSSDVLLSPDRMRLAEVNISFLRERVLEQKEAKRADKKYVARLILETEVFMDMFRELPHSAEALLLKADLYGLLKEDEGRLAALTKLLFEYPDSEFAEDAVTGISGLFTGKLKSDAKFDKGITEGASERGWADRYFQMIDLLKEFKDKDYMPYIMVEYDEFLSRYPRYPKADKVLRFKAEGYLFLKEYKSAAFTYAWLARFYPDSQLRSKAIFDLAVVYAGNLKEYELAVDTYERVVTDYPDGEDTMESYQNAAALYDKRLKDRVKAIERLESIVTKYPGDPAALEAFRYMSKLFVKKKDYKEAVGSLNRLADMFKGQDSAVEALVDSAKIASGKMKDYDLQIQVLRRIVDEYPNREEAVVALAAIADTYQKRLGNSAEAVNAYKSLIEKYPDHKAAESARKKVDKLLGQ